MEEVNSEQVMSKTGEPLFVGNRVLKTGGDYSFEGEVVAVFKKRSRVWRVVVENNDGILHIFSPAQLTPIWVATPRGGE